MKKFFALMLVVSMLAFASSAMAAVSLTATPATVNVTAGSATGATVTLTADGIEENLGPAWSFDLRNNPPSWVTLNGTDGTSRTRTLTLTPGATVTAATYTVTVRVRGSYKPSVHGARVTQTQSADISVVVAAATPASDTVPQPKQEKVTTTTEVSGASVVSLESANDKTTDELKNVSSTTIAAAEEKKDDMSASLGNKGITVPAGVPITGPSNITEYPESETRKGMTDQQKHESDAGEFSLLGTTSTYPGGQTMYTGTGSSFTATNEGMQGINASYPEEYYETKPVVSMKETTQTTVGSGSAEEFKAAAEVNGNQAVFLDSNGNIAELIPGVKKVSTDPEPGVLTAFVYVKPGIVYKPFFAVDIPADKVASVRSAAGVQTKTVTVVTEEVITVYESRTFSPVVEESAIMAVASARGIASKDLKLFDTTVAEGSSWDVSAAESAYMLANDIDEVARLPRLKDVEAGTYIAKISFDNTPRDAQTYGAPTLYPYGVKANGAATDATVYAISNNQAYEVPGSAIYDGMNAYLVVTVGTNGVAVADTDVNAAVSTIDRPTIAVKLNNVIGVGSSSGGCSAGSAVLALALLGTFIAARKK